MKNFSMWLKAAAIYNIIWGAQAIFFPLWQFKAMGITPPLYPQFWQCIGMIVGVYGLGYWWAAKDPIRHWPIVAVGLLGKIFGPIGFLEACIKGTLPWSFGINIIFNDILWWPSFTLIMLEVLKKRKETGSLP